MATVGGQRVKTHLSADPDWKTNDDGRNCCYSYETDANWTADEHRQLEKYLLLTTPLFLTPERAARRTAVTSHNTAD